jgi:glycosyltransferase involved in cell wall biosynthesis/GR25 family glycosyltransferase involved in LPS biosynthesis
MNQNPTFHILIATAGRPSLRTMMNSLKSELTEHDAITVVFDGEGAREKSAFNDTWLKGHKSKIHFIDQKPNLGFWGHGIRNHYQGNLQVKTTFIMHADDDDVYIYGSFDKLRKQCTDPDILYIAKFGFFYKELTCPKKDSTVIKEQDIGTPCGIIPFGIADKAVWQHRYGGDYEYYNSLEAFAKGVTFLDLEIYKLMNNHRFRLHLLGVPYTITRDEYSHDDYTGKVQRFSPMMRSRGFEVYHYGIETSQSGANKDFDLLTKDEWNTLRVDSLRYLDPKLSLEDANKQIENSNVLHSLMNWSTPLSKEFNRRLRIKLTENYRGKTTDIICLPLGRMHEDAIKGLDCIAVETGIGYTGSYRDFRIFETYAWMSKTLGIEDKQPNNYWFVIPHAFNVDEFQLSLKPNPLKVGFLGSISSVKGCGIIREVAKKFPHVQFVLCGSGDPKPFLDVSNVIYKKPIHGSERSVYLGDCVAFLHPVKYLEAFGAAPVEAQLCGTPVITSDWGGMVETIEQGKTGVLCHTLADYYLGVQMALDGVFDRKYIRERAVRLFDMYHLAYNYEQAFKSILDIYTPGKNGWYSPDTHIIPLIQNTYEGTPSPDYPLLSSKSIEDNKKIRIHIPAIPYTITRSEYSHDAFTNKVRLFSPMLRSRGFEVYHYGVETSESGATKQIDLLSKAEWADLRIKTLQFVEPTLSLEEAKKKIADPGFLVSSLSNWSSPLTKEFNLRFREKLKENYRGRRTDIICIPLSRTYQDALDKMDCIAVETGIGYTGSYMDFRIFEAYSWMSKTLGIEDKQPNNYWFVIPHAFNVNEFKLSLTPKKLRVGYMGRITKLKGCSIIGEIAKRFPHVEFVLCGQGDAKPFLTSRNIVYKEAIHGSERSDFLGSCIAFLHPAKYLEPFGCGPVEAQLCGTPVIASDWGGMAETVENYKTGLRCHTIADFCHGIQLALDGFFDRSYIRKRAENLYDMNKLAYKYEYALKSILDIYTPGKNGWYSPDTHLGPLLNNSLKNNIILSPSINIESVEVDQIYYINLDKRMDRNQHVLNQFKKAKIPLNKIRRFTAIDGDTYLFTEKEYSLFKNAFYMKTPSAKKIMGNQLSHFYIFKDMIMRGYKNILILQDDVVFRDEFINHLNSVVHSIPSDSEIINIGIHSHCYYNEFKAYDLTKSDDYIHTEKEKINDFVSKWKPTIQPCSLSYILTLKGAEEMIKHFEETGFQRETDIGFNRYLINKNIFYGSRTILCTGDPSFGTDIFNTDAWWKK